LRKVCEKPKRRLIGPLGIVDKHHQRLGCGSIVGGSCRDAARQSEQSVDYRVSLVSWEWPRRHSRTGKQLAGPPRRSLEQALALGPVR
jgi:hypothetical protein